MRHIIIAIVSFLCLVAAEARAEDAFSIYGLNFSQNIEQVLENLLERDFKVESTFVPIHLKEHVSKKVLLQWETPPSSGWGDGFPFRFPGMSLTQQQEQLASSSNESALMSYKLGKFKIVHISARKNFTEGNLRDGVDIKIKFYIDMNGKEHMLSIVIDGETIKNIILEEFDKRYGKPRKFKIGYPEYNVWNAGDVRLACKTDGFVIYAYVPAVIEEYIALCTQEIEKILQAQDEARRKEAEAAAARRNNIF